MMPNTAVRMNAGLQAMVSATSVEPMAMNGVRECERCEDGNRIEPWDEHQIRQSGCRYDCGADEDREPSGGAMPIALPQCFDEEYERSACQYRKERASYGGRQIGSGQCFERREEQERRQRAEIAVVPAMVEGPIPA